MAIGDTVRADGIEYEVCWSGGEGLVEPRLTKPGDFWTAPRRIYNKKSDYWIKPKDAEQIPPPFGVDKPPAEPENEAPHPAEPEENPDGND